MAAPMKQWLPQDAALVRFKDDPELLHWRGVLRCIQENECVVVTPNRDVETSTLAVGEVYQEVKRYELGRLPRGVRDKDTYLPRHSDQGDFSSEEMRRLVLIQEDLAANQDGGRRRISGKFHREGSS